MRSLSWRQTSSIWWSHGPSGVVLGGGGLSIPPEQRSAPAKAARQRRPGARSAKPIDACSMLSPQDISGVLGVTVQGKSTGKDPQMGDCSWENPTTLESVSIHDQQPGYGAQ